MNFISLTDRHHSWNQPVVYIVPEMINSIEVRLDESDYKYIVTLCDANNTVYIDEADFQKLKKLIGFNLLG